MSYKVSLSIVLFIWLLPVNNLQAQRTANSNKPNILLIFTDDMDIWM